MVSWPTCTPLCEPARALQQHTLPVIAAPLSGNCANNRASTHTCQLAQRARNAMQRGCALHRPACQASTSGAGGMHAPSVSSTRTAAPRQAAAAPARQPSLAPLVIDTGEFRCPACAEHPKAWRLPARTQLP